MANGLQQGCCMARVLFNLYTCLVVEQWCAKVGQVEGVGVELKYKYDGKLFRRYVCNACLQMMVPFLPRLDLVQRELCRRTSRSAEALGCLLVSPRRSIW